MRDNVQEILKEIKIIGFDKPLYTEDADGNQRLLIEASYIPRKRIKNLNAFCEKNNLDFEISNIKKTIISIEIWRK